LGQRLPHHHAGPPALLDLPRDLLQPYTTLDLESFTHEMLPLERYARTEAGRVASLTRQRLAEENSAVFSAGDIGGFERKLNAFGWLLRPGFPRGFSFQLSQRCLRYDGRHGRLAETDPAGAERGDFVISVPTFIMKEALATDHLSDLDISMFIRIRLLRRIDPRKVYLIFNLLGLLEYHHVRGTRALARWIAASLKHTFALRLPVPGTALPPLRP
jgi:hypothetical protein